VPEGSIPQVEDDQPGPAQPFSDTNVNYELSEEQHQHQYRTFMDIIEAAPPPPVQPLRCTHSSAEKENIQPPATPNTTGSMAKAFMDKVKLNIKKLPPKLSLEEALVNLSWYVFSNTVYSFLCANQIFKVKICKLSMS